MPLYEFYCSGCQEKMEELCNTTVESIRCPSCGKNAGRVFSTFSTGKGTSGGGATSSGCGG